MRAECRYMSVQVDHQPSGDGDIRRIDLGPNFSDYDVVTVLRNAIAIIDKEWPMHEIALYVTSSKRDPITMEAAGIYGKDFPASILKDAKL